MVYPLEELLGAELDLDGEVAARALRGEPRRGAGAPERRRDARCACGCLFDDPSHPDFELSLWPTQAARGGVRPRPRQAIAEANRWLARIEAVLRRTGGAAPRPSGRPSRGPRHRPLTADLQSRRSSTKTRTTTIAD